LSRKGKKTEATKPVELAKPEEIAPPEPPSPPTPVVEEASPSTAVEEPTSATLDTPVDEETTSKEEEATRDQVEEATDEASPVEAENILADLQQGEEEQTRQLDDAKSEPSTGFLCCAY
jgi:hypothetical protein